MKSGLDAMPLFVLGDLLKIKKQRCRKKLFSSNKGNFLILLFCLFYIHYSCKNDENDVKQKFKGVSQGPLKKWTEHKKLPIALGDRQKNPDNFMSLACHQKIYLIYVEFSKYYVIFILIFFSTYKTETANRAETAA